MLAEIAKLLPSTLQWMIDRGYLRVIKEDGTTEYQITAEGWYFIEGYRCNEPKSN